MPDRPGPPTQSFDEVAMCRILRSFLVVVLVAIGLPAGARAGGAKRPNIVILLADDLGYADVGFQGCKDIPTPNIDSLAASGVRCTNGYVSGPYCSPTRAGLLTGRYQQRFGHEFNPGSGARARACRSRRRRSPTGSRRPATPPAWSASGTSATPPSSIRSAAASTSSSASSAAPIPTSRGDRAAPILRGTDARSKETEYLTDAFAREAVAFIDRHKARTPFFLYLAFNAVHTPMQATDDRLKRFAAIADKTRRTYAAMTVGAGRGRRQGARQAPRREAGGEHADLLLQRQRRPDDARHHDQRLAQRPAARLEADDARRGHPRAVRRSSGRASCRPASATTSRSSSSTSCRPLWPRAGSRPSPAGSSTASTCCRTWPATMPGAPHETLYWRFGEQMAIRQGDWKLVRYDRHADPGEGPSLKTEAARVTGPKLYNLAQDIGESHDLAAQYPDKVNELQAVWQEWNAQLARPLWGAGND